MDNGNFDRNQISFKKIRKIKEAITVCNDYTVI